MSWPLLALYAIVRGVGFGAILLIVGSQAAAALVGRQLATYPDFATEPYRRLRRMLPPLLAIFLGACICKGALQLLSFVDPGEAISLDLVNAVLLSGTWGRAWLLQIVAAALFFGIVQWAPLAAAPSRVIAIAFTALLIWFQTGMGHAAGRTWPMPLGRLLDLSHLAGLGIWLGTLSSLAIVALSWLRDDERLPLLAAVVRNFSLYARIGVILVVISGTVAALVYVGPIASIATSTWGRLLLVKLTLMLGVLVLGWYNWRVVTPALDSGDAAGRKRLRFAVQLELALGILMLAITTMLVASALPGEG